MSVKATVGVVFGAPMLLAGLAIGIGGVVAIANEDFCVGVVILAVAVVVLGIAGRFLSMVEERPARRRPVLHLRATFHSDHDFSSPEYLASLQRSECNRFPDAFFAVVLRTKGKERQDAISSCRKGDELSLRFDRMNACVWVLRGEQYIGHLRKNLLRQIAWRVEKKQYRCVFYKAIVAGPKARATAHVYIWNHKEHPELEKLMDEHYELADKR